MLNKIKSHKRPVDLLFMVFTFATVYYIYVVLSFNFAQRILQNYDSKTFSVLFREHMGFLTRSIIYLICNLGLGPFALVLLTIIQIHFRKSQLPVFFLRCRVSVKQQNKKAIQLLPHLSEILTCNL